MDAVIAALILACSNLTHGDSNFDAKRKAECVQRVASCSELVTHLADGDLGRTGEVLKLCAKEVHL